MPRAVNYNGYVSRVRFASGILRPLAPRSILDVGCRDAELARYLPGVEYHGADLFPGERVSYVGDISTMTLGRSFDVIVACDILEHLDDPSGVFDRLVSKAERFVLISLPNTYDLKSHWKFLRGHMGGKYRFTEEAQLDRHKWLMNRAEIHDFARAKSRKHGMKLELIDMPYGAGGALSGKLVSVLLPRRLTAGTVFALFSR
jgi:hypothetical protein